MILHLTNINSENLKQDIILNKDLTKQDMSKSGICHHMMFETKYIKLLFDKIEKNHNDTFYNVFLKNVTETLNSGASEYEIYFNYLLIYHKNTMCIRTLPWENVGALCLDNASYSYISYHHYSR